MDVTTVKEEVRKTKLRRRQRLFAVEADTKLTRFLWKS